MTFAARLAQHCNAALHVLHAESRLLEAAARSRDIDLVAQTRIELQRFTEGTYPAANGLPLYYVVSDPPVAAICGAAARHHADLIVMGPHGRSRLERAVLGSTTEAVLLRATTDVLVVPPSWTPPVAELPGLSGMGPVVIGIRDPATAGPSIEAAEALASTLKSYVEVVHVVSDVPSETFALADTVLLLRGDPGRALLDHLATPGRLHSVLLLDRTHRRGRTELGRTTRTLLTHCQVPMFWRP